ncbi:response regulator [Caballeronia cordobensis]|uniref:response regulator n=1 Tax=Caballeronia cordobensis TaxID=1353886 RepID=UPI00158F2098
MRNFIRLAIADSCTFTTHGLKAWFEMHSPYRVSITTPSIDRLRSMLTCVQCDLIITELPMREGTLEPDPLKPLRELRRRYPELPFIVFTAETDAATLVSALLVGAAAIVSKGDGIDELMRVCERVRKGERGVFSRNIEELSGYAFDASPNPPIARVDSHQQRIPAISMRVRNFDMNLACTTESGCKTVPMRDPSSAEPEGQRYVRSLPVAKRLFLKLRRHLKAHRHARGRKA